MIGRILTQLDQTRIDISLFGDMVQDGDDDEIAARFQLVEVKQKARRVLEEFERFRFIEEGFRFLAEYRDLHVDQTVFFELEVLGTAFEPISGDVMKTSSNGYDETAWTETSINNYPRKCLNYNTS